MNGDLIKQLTSEKNRLLILVDAIDKLLAAYNVENVVLHTTQTEFESFVDTFNLLNISEAKSIPEKVLFSLKSLNVGTATEVAKKLVELDTSFNFEKAKRDCTVHLSRMFRLKLISAKTKGMSYTYQYLPQIKIPEM